MSTYLCKLPSSKAGDTAVQSVPAHSALPRRGGKGRGGGGEGQGRGGRLGGGGGRAPGKKTCSRGK